MSTYCASCLADLALVREAVTTVSGTAACVAHAVLLTHPGDTPQQRLTRLSDLRAMAEEKLPNASADDRPSLELLVQEYALAGAMDMTVPLKELAGDRTPRPPKSRRNRGRDRERPRPEGGPREGGQGDGGQGEGGPREGAPSESAPSEAAPAVTAPVEPAAPAPAPESAAPPAGSPGAE
jgi:hypothetical protein